MLAVVTFGFRFDIVSVTENFGLVVFGCPLRFRVVVILACITDNRPRRPGIEQAGSLQFIKPRQIGK